jgi:hypothetical protein
VLKKRKEKGTELWIHENHGGSLNAYYSVKEARLKELCAIWFHL